MTTEFSLTTRVDEPNAVLCMTVVGPIDSKRFVDECLAFFDSVPGPWLFDRINDLSAASGFVAYEDLSRMAAWWAARSIHATRKPRVAVVTLSKLVAARMPMIHQLNPSHDHRAFEDLSGAWDWIRGAAA